MVDLTIFNNYFEERQRVVDKIVQFCADNPTVPYKDIARACGCRPGLVGYYARKHGMSRKRGVKQGQKIGSPKIGSPEVGG